MAEIINFDRDRARYLLDCLAHGKPIEGVKTFDDFLALAGACLFAARSHGPLPDRARKHDLSGVFLDQLPDSFLVSTEETFLEDSNAAVEFYAHMTMLVKDGEYDQHFEPLYKGFVFVEDGGKKILPVEGYRQ